MRVIVSYDINSHHSEVLAACGAAGFEDRLVKLPNKHCKMPNTTLMIAGLDLPAVEKKFRNAVASVSPKIVIEKLILAKLASDTSYEFYSNDCKQLIK